jgi:predicted peptidase
MNPLRTLLALTVTAMTGISADIDPDLMQSPHRFETTLTRKVSMEYLLHLPEGYQADTSRRWPLILFLHGAGERGNDLNKVAVHGPPKLVSRQVRTRKGESPEEKAARQTAAELLRKNFIIASPQCPSNTRWHAQELAALLDEVEKSLRVDRQRIYLTGLSMGGYGTWDLGLGLPERFAALAPIRGGLNTITPLLNRRHPTRGPIQRDLPIWIFHGEKDGTVPPEESHRAVDLLKRLGCRNVKLTTYPEAGHDSWTATYENPELYRWFLEHTTP